MFAPRREHARFCSARCRVAWNRLNASESPAAGGASTGRSPRCGTHRPAAAGPGLGPAARVRGDQRGGMVGHHGRRHPGALPPGRLRTVSWRATQAERRAIEGTFGGLRFVRNQMGYYLDQADFIQPGRGGRAQARSRPGRGGHCPSPGSTRFGPRAGVGHVRYREYQAWLAAQPVGETFRRAAAFLRRAAAGCLTHSEPAGRGALTAYDAPNRSSRRGRPGRDGSGSARRPRRPARGRLSRGRGQPGW